MEYPGEGSRPCSSIKLTFFNVFRKSSKRLPGRSRDLQDASLALQVLGRLSGEALGVLVKASGILGAISWRPRVDIRAVLGVLGGIWKSFKSHRFLYNFSNLETLRMPQGLL